MAPEAGARGADPAVTRVGKYQILGRIGHGAMGQVFRALDPLLNRQVAIKMMAADVSGNPDQIKRFLVEAQSAARLNHPNIVTLHDFGEDNGQFYMAMELLEGQDLSAVIKQRRLQTLEDKLALMEQVCEGLAFAHAMDVVHRDLKPANIHVSANGRVKIMDFGLARLGRSEMTRAGAVMGSPNYMSPEQVRGERVDTRSDVFALGSVFYEVLTGRRAFTAEAMHVILYKVTDTEPEPLSQIDPDLPLIVIEVIERALRKDPRQRFVDARDMREALDVCRRVLEGTLDEETGLASIHLSSTLPESTPAASATDVASGTASSLALTLPALAAQRAAAGAPPPARVAPPGGTRQVAAAVQPGSRSRPGSQPASVAPSAPSVAASTGPLYAAIGVAALAVVAVAYFALRGTPAQAPPAEKSSGLVAVAVDAQLDVARKAIEYKDPRGAIDAADKALRIDPASAEAKSIREKAQADLAAIEVAVQEARTAAQAGDTEKATQAVTRVLALASDHPIAAELTAQLNSKFQGRAEDALREMKSAGAAAQRANGSSLREYGDAGKLARQAEEAFGKNKFTEATQKALEAKKSFDNARASATAGTSSKPPTPVAGGTAPPPAVSVTIASPPPTLSPVTAPPPPTVTIAPPPPTIPTPIVAATTAPVVTTPVTLPAVSDDTQVRRLFAEFARAIEEKDVALYKTLRPTLSAAAERTLKTAFQNVRSQTVNLSVDSVKLDGASAVVRVTRTTTVNGEVKPAIKELYRLAKGPTGWTIQDIGQ